MPTRHVAVGAVLTMLALSLAGCQSLRQAAGLERSEPDEFAISTKAPLVIPPDYNLRPPSPGAPPTNTLDPTEAAEAALAGMPSAATKGPLSVAEQDLLTKADANAANDSIRQRIAADNRKMQMADQSFTDQLLFGLYGPVNNADSPVNAVAEKARLDAKGHAVTAPVPQDSIRKGTPGDQDQGLLGNLFDGLF